MEQRFQTNGEGQDNEVPSLSAENLSGGAIRHGFFLRKGGVSEGVYASLNCGRGSNDKKDCVEENRARAAAQLGADSSRLIGPRQVHSAKAVIVSEAWEPAGAPEADAIVTRTPRLAIGVLTADCAPVLLADAEAGVVAAVHAGWKGAKSGVVEAAIDAMESLGAKAGRVAAAIGPAISETAYEVGQDFMAVFLASAETNAKYFSQEAGSKPHFNLRRYVKDKLLLRGVVNIQEIGGCTYESESILFSYRRSVHREETDYGRQISAILIG